MVEAGLDGLGQAALGRPLEGLGVVDHGLTVQELACRGRAQQAAGAAWGGGSARQQVHVVAPDWMCTSSLRRHASHQMPAHHRGRPCCSAPRGRCSWCRRRSCRSPSGCSSPAAQGAREASVRRGAERQWHGRQRCAGQCIERQRCKGQRLTGTACMAAPCIFNPQSLPCSSPPRPGGHR